MSFRDELRQAYPDPSVIEREQGAFESWYRGNCYAAWLRFAAAFPRGAERLNGAKEWRAVAETMPTDQGPYFAFFDRAAADLASFGELETLPPLLQQVIQFRLLKSGSAAGAASKAVEEGKRLSAKVGDLLGKPVPGTAAADSQLAAAKAAADYRAALALIAPAAKSRPRAYQMAQQVFAEDPALSKSPFYQAHEAAQRLNGQLIGGRGEASFARLSEGPLSFLWSYVQREAACAVQSQWEEQVLREAQGSRDPQMLQYLVAQEGPVWRFVNGSLGAFQGWSPGRGYYAKTALGGQVPFQPAFFTFLAKGTKAKVALARPAAKQASYPVTIKGLPTDANGDAKVKPQSTRLELQCAAGPQIMENLNYTVSKTFTWGADSCGEVTLQIEVGELVLTRQYPGFPAFLKEFQGGRHTFYPKDFPREKAALERLGVRFIRPSYQFSGVVDVVAQGGGAAGTADLGGLPAKIAQCWD
jgi:type VI secretion system protein ImpL